MGKILVVHGPNLNMLGFRQPDVYGCKSLSALNEELTQYAAKLNFKLQITQSNSEEQIITTIHKAAANQIDYIIINPAAFTHTSIAIRDALLSIKIPFIEVHLSNIHARESFRSNSYFSDIALGVITGFGAESYSLALQAISTISKRESI